MQKVICDIIRHIVRWVWVWALRAWVWVQVLNNMDSSTFSDSSTTSLVKSYDNKFHASSAAMEMQRLSPFFHLAISLYEQMTAKMIETGCHGFVGYSEAGSINILCTRRHSFYWIHSTVWSQQNSCKVQVARRQDQDLQCVTVTSRKINSTVPLYSDRKLTMSGKSGQTEQLLITER